MTDCGRIINPQLLEQQIQGGIAQGLGYALIEEYRSGRDRILTADLTTYILPTAVDVPDMESMAVDSSNPAGLSD